jgi:hypothetical protein
MRFLVISLLILFISSCGKVTKMPPTPKLKFGYKTPNIVKAGSNTNIIIFLALEDGDGDVGFGTPNLFLRDSRYDEYVPFVIPTIPEAYNPKDGIKGTLTIEYNAAFLLLRNDSVHFERDTLQWHIYMRDQAGNMSDTVLTDPLILTQ